MYRIKFTSPKLNGPLYCEDIKKRKPLSVRVVGNLILAELKRKNITLKSSVIAESIVALKASCPAECTARRVPDLLTQAARIRKKTER